MAIEQNDGAAPLAAEAAVKSGERGAWIPHTIWFGFCSIAVGLLVARFAGGLLFGERTVETLAIAALAPALVYLLFLLEGAQVAAIQVKAHPIDAAEFGRARSLFALRDRHRRNIERLQSQFRDRFFAFIIGRQFLVIAAVVGLAILINRVAWPVETIAADAAIGGLSLRAIVSIVNGDIAAFLIATALPYWIAQLLSQILADERPIPFLRLPGLYSAVQATYLMDRIGIGRPALFLETLIARNTAFERDGRRPRRLHADQD
ncbi:MAG: hypothetical protein Tsb0010_13180 [Parvularculaceae bacterium]